MAVNASHIYYLALDRETVCPLIWIKLCPPPSRPPRERDLIWKWGFFVDGQVEMRSLV